MSEFIKTAEVIGRGLQFAQKIGSILVSPFHGGWSELGKTTDPEPQAANITIYEGEDHIIRGEE